MENAPLAERAPVFTRDRFTWLAYILIALITSQQASMGPLMPFMRDELGLNYTEGSYHLSGMALSVVFVGLVADRIIGRTGRRASIWLGATVFAAGLALVMAGRILPVTVGGALLIGAGGALMQTPAQAGLADRHGPQRAQAISEANVGASLLATLAPFLIGFFQRSGFLGWRGALLSAALAIGVVALVFRRTPIPEPAARRGPDAAPARGLPLLVWLYCILLAITSAIEWSTAFWGADFLEKIVGLERVDAATVMSLFFVAMVAGRFVGSRLTRRMSSTAMLTGALMLSTVGFALLWLGRVTPVNLIGLFGVGLGIANIFPQGLSIALGIAPELANKASARVAFTVGLAIFIAPQTLGRVADSLGLWQAFGLVGVTLLASLVLGAVANTALMRRADKD